MWRDKAYSAGLNTPPTADLTVITKQTKPAMTSCENNPPSPNSFTRPSASRNFSL